MTDCEHVRPALGAFILGALEDEEDAAVRRHLATCARCSAGRDALAPLPGLVASAAGADAATAEPLSLAFEERLLDAFARDRAGAPPPRRRRWRRLRPRWLVAVAGVVAAAIATAVLVTSDDSPRRWTLDFQPATAGTSARASGWVESAAAGSTLSLSLSGLRGGERAVYEVLCDARGWTASAGTFHADAGGHARVVMSTAARWGEYRAVRVVRKGATPDEQRDVLVAELT